MPLSLAVCALLDAYDLAQYFITHRELRLALERHPRIAWRACIFTMSIITLPILDFYHPEWFYRPLALTLRKCEELVFEDFCYITDLMMSTVGHMNRIWCSDYRQFVYAIDRAPVGMQVGYRGLVCFNNAEPYEVVSLFDFDNYMQKRRKMGLETIKKLAKRW